MSQQDTPKGIRVFISYSADKDEDGNLAPESKSVIDLRDKIKVDLESAKHLVKFDEKDLELGMQWRHEINIWLSKCQVAILLINDSALNSEYVAYEIAILNHRREIQGPDEFLIIPVFLDEIGRSELKNSLLKEIPLFEIQSSVIKDNHQEIVSGIKDKIEKADEKLNDLNHFSVQYIAKDVFQYIADDHPELIERSEELGISVDTWVSDRNLKEKLALKLLSKGIENGRLCIFNLIPFLSDDPYIRKVKTKDLLGLVASSWVDKCCVNAIEKNWKSKIFVLNNSERDLPLFYLYNINPPKAAWEICSINNNSDENFIENLNREIWSNLKTRLKIDDEKKIVEELGDKFDFEEKPLCVSVALEFINQEIVDNLRKTFPKVVFFFLVKRPLTQNEESLHTQLIYLEPYLNESEEKILCETYNKCYNRFLNQG